MLRLIIAAVIGMLIGAGATFGVMVATYPTHGQLDCSVNPDGTVTECTDGNGKQVGVPHDVRIR